MNIAFINCSYSLHVNTVHVLFCPGWLHFPHAIALSSELTWFRCILSGRMSCSLRWFCPKAAWAASCRFSSSRSWVSPPAFSPGDAGFFCPTGDRSPLWVSPTKNTSPVYCNLYNSVLQSDQAWPWTLKFHR